MLIPISEILSNDDHYAFKASCENALEYQLKKVLHLTKKVEKGLDDQANGPYFYVTDEKFSYNLDALIHNLSILTEYYHGWVVFSYIGTNSQGKTKYIPLKKDEKLSAEIDKIFKLNSIGVLNSPKKYRGDFYEDCKKAFLKAYDFLFIGKFYEIYVLNNYLKHNTVAMSYAPKAMLGNREISIPYVYIGKPNDRLLNTSVFKSLIDHEFDEYGKMSSIKDDYFVSIINATARPVCSLGGYKVYNINGLDYLKGGLSVGLSMESIVEVAHELVSNIARIFIESSSTNPGRGIKLNRLVAEITARPPKTLAKLVNV
ncbi:hypothetical protein PSCICO_08710 [Pseudomonas cichorii]|uniref:hypothetical protein n=1 Tax=Pseudomonas cichorii TaxID=36746 RepID=UPI001910EA92|nr:hypothetical protein [Pseudomonas cichorii]GFM85472.1 hypothetical protein PSCICO_08710 [Pseudomonas cichorii]